MTATRSKVGREVNRDLTSVPCPQGWLQKVPSGHKAGWARRGTSVHRTIQTKAKAGDPAAACVPPESGFAP